MILKDCINELIKMEENASILYDREVSEADERFKPVMKRLSSEELKHREFLLDLLEKKELLDYVLNEEIVKCLESQKVHLKEGISKNPSQKEFFKFALQIEENSAELYEKLASYSNIEENFEKTFSKLVFWEKRHMIFILSILHEMN